MDVSRISTGLTSAWSHLLADWDRTLRSSGKPETTRYNYLLAVAQFARFLTDNAADCAAGPAAPAESTRAHIEEFQAWMIETRSASTALNKHKVLQQFFKWLAEDEQEIDRSPMERVKAPTTPTKLVPVMGDEDTKKILDTCNGKTFTDLRDQAIIRLYYGTGARLAEVANLTTDDLDMATDSVVYQGKGGKSRRVRFGPKTARALSRYLRARSRHRAADVPSLWLAARGAQPLQANGIKIMLKRRGKHAGVSGVHAHRWRHNYAHAWKLAGGDTGDLMLLLGWSTDAMARHYGASAAAERAQEVQLRMRIGENV
ncbi:site-specific recombinase XerD [Saccharopolyspora erythraea NRRL 2338]|uniref:Site-specific recombinase XerD n=1 Tax=Saccharopolyspora erythraea TaxID=1836 RepID=A0ABN1E7A7_SACER|nr:tyrosine-type recombinase/integrase [Saccharopolyspora erythraea]PFG97988.1 site-specific recombinase XerD [Saccharopolyspora erythraea NRRL 2338]QRK88114.1 tyrosine-type recombinase/integrase [Saccharopolyspora erythraea]